MGEDRFESYLDVLERHGDSMRRSALRRMAGVTSRQELTEHRQTHPEWKQREAKILKMLKPVLVAADLAQPDEPKDEESTVLPQEGGEEPLLPPAPPSGEGVKLPSAQRRFLSALRKTDDRMAACAQAYVDYADVKLWLRESPVFRELYEGWRESLLLRNEDAIARKGADGDTSAAKTYLSANSVRYRGKAEDGGKGEGPLEDLDVARERDRLFREMAPKLGGALDV